MKSEFLTRWVSGVQFDDVIVWNGGIFNLYSVLPIGRREGMRLRARRRDNDSRPLLVVDSEGNETTISDSNPAT